MRDSQHATVTDAPGQLAYARVNPVEHGEEIKELFLAHERPEFPAFFDRTYADAVADGATSWIGRDAQGRLCAHVAQFPRPFRLGNREVRGALLANLMVAKEHRTLWPALKLMRRVVHDSKTLGSVDFLYGDPNEAAHAIVRAVGFRTVGALWRFVSPVSDRRRVVDWGIGLYQLLRGFRVTSTDLEVRVDRAIELPAGPEIPEPAEPGLLSPAPRPAVYRHRLPGYPAEGDHWYTFHRRHTSTPIAAILVRAPDARGLAIVGALPCASSSQLGAVLLGLTRVLRGSGIERVEVSLMGASRAAEAAQRAGFVARDERIPVVALALTALGAEALESGAEWRLLPVDLDR